MANQGAKKRVEENARRLVYLRIALLAGIGSFVLIRMLLRGGFHSKWQWTGLLLTLGIEAFTYTSIAGFAAPVYDGEEIVFGGADLSMGGMCGYYHDLMYVSVAVQVLAAITNWAWYLYLSVPAYGSFLLYKHVLHPYFTSSGTEDEQQDEATRKKLERAQQRSERRQAKRR